MWRLEELVELSVTRIAGGHARFEFSDDFRLKQVADFQRIKEWQDQFFILKILFGIIESLDFIADPVVHGINFRFAEIRMNSSVQEDDSFHLGHGGMSPQPVTVFSL